MTADSLFKDYYNLLVPLVDAEDGEQRAERFEKLKPIAKRCAIMAIKEMQKLQVSHPLNWGASSMQLEFIKIEIEKL